MSKVNIFGVSVDNTTFEETRDNLDSFLKEDRLHTIYTPNTEIIMAAKEDQNIRNILNTGDLVLPDGIGLIYGSKIRKHPLKERVTGFDTSIEMLKLGEKYSLGIYLLGGEKGVSEIAAKNIKEKYPNIRISGYHNGFFRGSHLGEKDSHEEREIIDEINLSKTDIVFVGLGFPRQEIWIDANKDKIDGKLIIGNGGVIDILAGKAKRAPKVFQDLGLEWFYRLLQNPSRIKRQMSIPKFLWKIIFDKDSVKLE